LYNESTLGDEWTARKLLAESAENGDGKATFALYASPEYIVKTEDAFELLDAAIECNIPDALYENAFLIEHGVRKNEDLFYAHCVAVMKGSALAATNSMAYYKYVSPSKKKLRTIYRIAEETNVAL